MAEYKTDAQVNYGFPLTFDAAGKFPIIAKRIWNTYDEALAWVNNPDEYAVVGLQLSVINDNKKNGVYLVTKIGTGATDEQGNYIGGELTKVGEGTGSLAISELTIDENGKIIEATQDNIGQIIYLTADSGDYPAGPYIVTGEGTIAKIGTTTPDEDLSGAITTLQGQVSTLETWINGAKVKDVQYGGATLATNGIVSLDTFALKSELPVVPEYTIENNGNLQYQFKKGDDVIGTIDIPKDMFVQSGEVVELTDGEVEGKAAGTYIKLVLNDETQTPLYIAANDLVDNYTATGYISISDDRVITLNVTSLEAYFNDKYDTKGDAAKVQTNLDTFIQTVTDANYVKEEDLDTKVGNLGYAKTEDLGLDTFITKDSLATTLNDYYKASEIDTKLSGYVTTEALEAKGYATEEWVEENYIKKNDLGSISTSDIDAIVNGEQQEEPENPETQE